MGRSFEALLASESLPVKSLILVRKWRLLSQVFAVCVVSALGSHAQAQPKSIDEIEAEIAARRSVDEAVARGPLDARYKQIAEQLDELGQREGELSVAGPVTGMVMGYGGASVLLAATQLADRQNDGPLALGAVGLLTVGIATHVWLGSRLRERRAIRLQSEWLRREQSTLTGSPSHRLEARARFERDSATRRELVRAREEYKQYGITAPIILMSTGLVLTPPLILLGLLVNAFGNDPSVLLTGVATGLVGIGGGVWLGHRKRARKPVAERIRKLEAQLATTSPVTLGLQLSHEHASFSLSARF